ncbi:uncharacterized protein KQ657_003980 [Scheffersomyces spartinae]|uniref:DASH complex subunit DAD2 n=1 Tax=Scheffersomyces spartinae TaxID=45513 RepID=A0A9P7VBK4_9ASCO|nr:uncharacterized protein KQ657_003980 [Scheffersomyces spartinae]KAG7194872.1 hypothetical protein KQ657_003980 [Scheffersomyces spartinae]
MLTLEAYQLQIAERQAELKKLLEFRDMAQSMGDELAALQHKLDTMEDGAKGVALVLSNWHNVTRAISLASLSLSRYSEKDYVEGHPVPERLVRIRLDKDSDETTT